MNDAAPRSDHACATPARAAPVTPLAAALREALHGLHGGIDEVVHGHRPRSVEAHEGRGHIEVRGIHEPGREALVAAVEQSLAELEGVRWARAIVPLGIVAVAFEAGGVDPDDLVEVVERLEDEHGVADRTFALLSGHPADTAPLRREAVKLVADMAGMGVALAERALHVPPLAVEIANVLPVAESLPPLRRLVRGRPRLAEGVTVTSALLQGLAQGPFGLANDALRRGALLAELRERRATWLRLEADLAPAGPPRAQVEPAGEARPVALQASAFERATAAAALASVGVGAATLSATGDARRSANVIMSGIPRGGWFGLDAFAATVGWQLARRDVMVMEPQVLRLLDRVDTLVLDPDAVATGAAELGEAAFFGDVDPGAVRARLARLFDPDAPGAIRREDAWTLGPAPDRLVAWPDGSRRRLRELRKGRRPVLVLDDGARVVALVAVRAALTDGARELLGAARAARIELVVAARNSGLARELGVERTVAGGRALARSVEQLRAAGGVVAVLSATSGAGLRAADCGIGLARPGAPTPWGAPVLCRSVLDAVGVIEAIRGARLALRRTLYVSLAGSGAGMLTLSTSPYAPRRAAAFVNLSSLAATATGIVTAAQLPPPRRPAPEGPPWHALEADEVLERLESGPKGLTSDEAGRRHVPAPPRQVPGAVAAVASELANPLTVVLSAGAAASAAVGSVVDAVLISSALGVNAAAGAFQRLRTEVAVERLSRAAADGTVRVLRDGERQHVDAADLVVGDVVVLEAGDAVRADGRLIEASQLEVDESSLTGESLPVAKAAEPLAPETAVADRRCMVYAGSSVAAGAATAVVVATGADVEARRAIEPGAAPPPTGVEIRLRELTRRTVPVVLGAGAALTLNGIVRGQPVGEAVAPGVGLTAAAVPEGLPFVATVAQTAAAKRLSGRGVIVRNPSVLEALGRVDVLCFDKTGTLTEGELVVRSVSDGRGERPVDDLGEAGRSILAAALRATPHGRGHRLPHPTDRAIVVAARAVGVDVARDAEGWRRRAELPFEPGRSFHATAGSTRDGRLLSVKGAPEVLLARCARWRRAGTSAPLDGRRRRRLERELDRLARQGLRVLAVAESAAPAGPLEEDELDGLDFLGFVACGDPARASASAPIASLIDAGIQTVMVTGDHPSTAAAIAAELGLLNGRRVLAGTELDHLDDASLDALIGEVAVFARTTPANKVRIVQAFERAGKVVAMTGDGANDAQAIRLASVGIAFGPRATAAAREVADLVVVNDSLATLTDAITEGRAMWASVREALAVLLGGNLGEAAFTTGAALLAGRSPLTARQLLAVNLFTDLVPALALAAQPSRPDAAALARTGPDASLGAELSRQIAIRAAATAAGAASAWAAASLTGTPAHARTVALATLVGGQLGQTVVAGRTSWLTVASAALSAAGLVAMVETPGVNAFFDCRPLGVLGWGITASGTAVATVGAIVADRLLPPTGGADDLRP